MEVLAQDKDMIFDTLNAIMLSSKKNDLLSLANILYLFQQKTSHYIFDDFEEFGKLGVNSQKLNLHYNQLLDKTHKTRYTKENTELFKDVVNFAKLLTNIPDEKIGLLVYHIYHDIPLTDQEIIRIKKTIL